MTGNDSSKTFRVVDFSGAKVTVEGDGLYIDNNKTLGSRYLVYFYSNTDFLLKEGATLNVSNNIFSNKAVGDSVNYFVEFNGSSTPLLYGNLEIVGNKLGGCGTNNNAYTSALKFAMDEPVAIGNGRIIVKDNKSYKDSALTTLADEDTYPSQHMFQLLSHAKTHSLFTMSPGKKLNPESKIDGVAFYYASGTGKLLEWDTATYGTDDYHEDVFIPDKFFNEYLGEGVVNGYASLKYATSTDGEHDHKVCGRAMSDPCTHTEVAAHTKNIEYKRIGERLKDNIDIFVKLMSAADKNPEDDMYFYLDEDIETTSSKNITLRNNIYLCLNGHSLKGFTFNTANGNTLYITNCKTAVGRIENTTASGTIMLRVSTEIYGVNKNLVPRAGSLIAHEAKNVVFYDTLFDNNGRTSHTGTTIIHTGTANASFKIEKCKFVNFDQGLEMLKTSANGVTVILKDTEFEKCNNMASRFFQMYNNTSSRNKLIFKGENSIHDCVSTSDNASSGAAFHFGYSDITIEAGASLKYYNNQLKTGNRNCIMWFDRSNFNIEETGSLEITDNLMYQCKVSKELTIILGISQNSNTANVYGDLKITGNVISNCTNTTGTYLAALDLRGGVINIGSGKLTINNNRSSKNADATGAVDASIRGYHMFNVYSANINSIFAVKSGSKINLDSRIDTTFYDSTDGKVMLWNNNTTSDLNAYKTIFTTDSYGDDEGMEVFFKNGYAVVESKDSNHIHKLCGIATNSTCTHTLVSSHGSSYQYVRITKATGVDKLVTTLQGDATSDSTSYYFLKADYNTTSEKVVTLKKDLYLCLNGHTLTGFRFAGNGKKLYICNCVEDKKVSVGSKLSGNITFTTGAQIYGIKKNITVVSCRVADMTDTYNNPNVNLYDVDVDGNSSNYPTSEYAVFYMSKASSILNIEDCDFFGHKKFHFFFSPQITSTVNIKNSTFRDMSNCIKTFLNLWKDKNKQVTMNLYGEVKFDNISFAGNTAANIPANQLSGCNFNVKSKATVSFTNWNVANCREMIRFSTNAKFTVEEGANFIVDNNILNKTDVANENNAIIAYHNDSTVACNILGNFKLTNNKINNCGTKKGGTALAAFMIDRNAAGPVTLGKGKIEIYNNKSYRDNGNSPVDDRTYPHHHMFGVYAVNKSLIFAQKSGTKFNTESFIENVAFSTPDYSGKVAKWTTTEVDASDIGKFNQVFTADPYWDDELWTEEKENYGVIGFGAPNHKHKLCGVATSSTCMHDASVSHDETIGYRKISSMYTSGADVKALLQTGGAYVLTADIEIEKLTGSDKYINVTPAKDLYICLNGHSFKGIVFTGGTNYSVYITNCQNVTAEFGNAAVANPAFNNISGEIYGINKNINVFYDRLANLSGATSAKQRVRLYSATFTKGLGSSITDPYIYAASESSNSILIDNCDFSDLSAHSFIRSVGSRTFVFNNNSIKNVTTTNYFMHIDSGTTKAYFKGNNIFENINYANKASDYFIHFGSYAANEVKISGNLSITNCESYYNTNHFFHVGAGHMTVDDNSKLIINNNRLYNTAIYGRALLYLGNNADFNLYGSLEIKDNEFVGTRQSHSDAGLWYANSKVPINIGSTSIVISNNTTTNAKANVRNLYSYYEKGVFAQKSGTRFKALDSKIDSVAINSEDYTGVIYTKWDDENVEGFVDVFYTDVFKADTYGGRKGIITAKDGEKVIITFGDHFHKICGTLATMSCVHPGINDHGEGTTPDIMHTYLALRWDDMADLANKLRLGGEYFLIRKIKFDTPTVIDLQADLYLCLTSYYMENVIFTSSTGKKVYISTCIEQFEEQQDDEEEEEIEYDEFGKVVESPTANMGSKRNDRYEVALVATASNAGTMFNCGFEIYSPHRILNIYANKLYETASNEDPIILNGVNLHNDGETVNGGNYIEITGNEDLILNNVNISTMSNIDYVVKTDNSTLNISGDTNIYKNTLNKGFFDVKSLRLEHGSMRLYENAIKREPNDQSFIKISTESFIYGELHAVNNKVINADQTNNSGRLAILNVEAPAFIHIGNSKIFMGDNYSYSDEGYTRTNTDAYLSHYVYSIYSDNYDGIFEQDDGTGMDTSSRVNISFADPKYMGTVVRGWRSGDICETIFTADHNIDAKDDYDRIKLNTSLDGSNVIIDNKVRIYYKEGILEETRKGVSPIAFYDIAYYGEPYDLKGDLFRQKGRSILGYVDDRGNYYSIRTYPTGLVKNRGKVILRALWSSAYTKDDWNIPDHEEKTKIIHDTVFVGGEWQYIQSKGKWMYYLNASENAVESIFPDGDGSLYVAMAGTDLRGYMRNGIYQIYWDGAPYYFRFDENGYMVTGVSEADGDYYYFEEEGILTGAMRFAPMDLGSKKLIFDVYGRIVRAQDVRTGEVTVLSSTYQRMVGMDDYYDEIPSLVGWH